MKIEKVALIISVVFILYIPAWFVYTRFCLPQYKMDSNTLTYKESVYIIKDSFSPSDTENLGKTIGIAIYGKRKLSDYIWPFWVSEYKGDKEHNRIFVRGLMDLGTVYQKDLK